MKQKKNKKSRSSPHDIKTEIECLYSYWQREKEAYKTDEVGSGVQKFVKKVLLSSIFNLIEGEASTPNNKRRYEFLEERTKMKPGTKERGQPDVVIHIDGEIVIPVEIEKHRHIKDGEKQIFKYQNIWQKHYGILTDGYTWRFYINNVYRTFTIDDIFFDTKKFQIYWKEYIKPEYYYLDFFEAKNSHFPKKEIVELQVEHSREIFFDDITKIIENFKHKLEIEGYFKDLESRERSKRSTEIAYAYLIQFILYKTLVDNAFGDFEEKYQKTIHTIFKCLKEKNYSKILNLIEGITNEISKNIYRPFKTEQKFIDEKLRDISRQLENTLNEVSPWLDVFVFIKKYNFSNVHNEIFGYIYENYLKELYDEEEKGQYFTDPLLVDFMLDHIGYSHNEIVKRHRNDPTGNSLSIIDPACGSGTFLYSIVSRLLNSLPHGSERESRYIEKLTNNHVFGLDIDEFPLYLAEMSIIMRLLPIIINETYNNPIEKKIKLFETKDSISEFIGDDLGQRLEISSFMRDEFDLKECKDSLKNNNIPRRRFDYVIGNPPYIGYNKASKAGIQIFKLIKEKGEYKNVYLSDIYGMNLHSIPGKPKRNRPNPNLYAFFIALGLHLLKPGGKLCYIIPQTLLNSGALDTLRFHLAKYVTIEKVIIFSGKMFIGRGIRQKNAVPTSNLILIVSKKSPTKNHNVQWIYYKNPYDNIESCLNNIKRGKNVKKTMIAQSRLLDHLGSWNLIKESDETLRLYEKYQNNGDDISIYYQHDLAQEKFGDRFYFDSGYSIDEKKLLQCEPSSDFYLYPKFNKDSWIINNFRGYWPNVRSKGQEFFIELRQANQGYKLLDSKYKIVWSYRNPDHFYFSDIPLIWARNQYCAIGSNSKDELMFLLAVLNSKITKFILSILLKTKHEKDFLVSTKSIKQFVRIPKITKNNKSTKKSVINIVEKMLQIESTKLGDLVDFSSVLIQKFDKIIYKKNSIILISKERRVSCPIIKEVRLVKKVITSLFNNDLKAINSRRTSLSQLKSLPAINQNKINKLKGKIDDCLYKLYNLNSKEKMLVKKTKDAEINFLHFMSVFKKLETMQEKDDFLKTLSKDDLSLIVKVSALYEKDTSTSREFLKTIKELKNLITAS